MIKFPKVHIARSVTNRILNIADGIAEERRRAAPDTAPPSIPDVATQSDVLESRLSQPPSGALPGLDQAPDPGATAAGKPLLTTMLEPSA